MDIKPAINVIQHNWSVEVASLEAIDEMIEEASSLQAPYDSATMGTHTHPSSEHLGSLAWCFLASVTWAADLAKTPASKRVKGFSGKVMETSSAAGLSKNQLDSKISAGRVLLWSWVRLLPTSTWTPMCARRQVSTRISLILLWRETTSPPYLQVTAWWPRWSSTPGHRVHWEPSEVSRPSHHFTAIWKQVDVDWVQGPQRELQTARLYYYFTMYTHYYYCYWDSFRENCPTDIL